MKTAIVVAAFLSISLTAPVIANDYAHQIVTSYYKKLQKQVKGDPTKLARLEAAYRKHEDKVRKASAERSRPLAEAAAAAMKAAVK